MVHLKKFNYRFAEQILNSKLELKQEIEEILKHPSIDPTKLNRRAYNEKLEKLFVEKGWTPQPPLFEGQRNSPRMGFLKERVGVEVGFSHSSFIG